MTSISVSSTLYSVFVDVFDKLPAVTDDRLLACIYGGILTGVGTGILLNVKASTGGTELVTNIIRSYNAKYTTSKLIIIIDTVIVILNVILSIIDGFKILGPMQLVTQGGYGTTSEMLYIYNTAFQDGQIGRACAYATILFLIILIFTIIQRIISGREVKSIE